jgi:hypothetical protein
MQSWALRGDLPGKSISTQINQEAMELRPEMALRLLDIGRRISVGHWILSKQHTESGITVARFSILSY